MIEFGPPIEVNGVRPEWLSDDNKIQWAGEIPWSIWDTGEPYTEAGEMMWHRGVKHIKLVSTHPHYTKDTAMTQKPAKPTRIVIPDGPAEKWAEKRADELWASVEGKSGNSVLTFAAHLIAMLEQPPVDPVLMKAREIYAEKFDEATAKSVMSGSYDKCGGLEYLVKAIRIGQEMGKGEV